MNKRKAFIVVAALGAGLNSLGCGGEGRTSPEPAGASESGGTSPEGATKLACPASVSGRFDDTPKGACVGAGSCTIEIDTSCRPGVSFVPSTAPVFECRCISNQWNCVLQSGGLGLTPCGEAGASN